MVSVHVMKVDTAFHSVKTIVTAIVARNVLMVVVEDYVLPEISALKDKYVCTEHVSPVVIITEIVVMICFALLNCAYHRAETALAERMLSA